VFEPLDDEELDDEETDGTGLLHHESGTFVWQDVARPAERTLRFLADDDGAGRPTYGSPTAAPSTTWT
jgi:hypothetical protein